MSLKRILIFVIGPQIVKLGIFVLLGKLSREYLRRKNMPYNEVNL